tara:strand:- start:1402 stop:1662 length:261 start_codon:yes stop_codon:yes gene_type:complete
MKVPELKSFINSGKGKIILSVLLGFGIATLFRKACKDRNCLVFSAPSINKVKGKVFGFNDKCYKYIEKNATCSDNKTILEMVKENA